MSELCRLFPLRSQAQGGRVTEVICSGPGSLLDLGTLPVFRGALRFTMNFTGSFPFFSSRNFCSALNLSQPVKYLFYGVGFSHLGIYS